jgi:hypothetical protein
MGAGYAEANLAAVLAITKSRYSADKVSVQRLVAMVGQKGPRWAGFRSERGPLLNTSVMTQL